MQFKRSKKILSVLIGAGILIGSLTAGTIAAFAANPTDGEGTDPEPGAQSTPVTVDEERSGLSEEDGCWYLYLDIGEGDAADVQVDLSEAVLGLFNAYAAENGMDSYPVLPGDSNMVKVCITNRSGHTYAYQRGSFVLSPLDVSDFPEEELSPFTGYDGQRLPFEFISAVPASHKAIYRDLFGCKGSADVTADMMFGIYDVLAEKGYTGKQPLTDYMLDYYNEFYHADYATWEELAAAKPSLGDTLAQAGVNSIFKMSAGYLEQLKQEHPEIAPYAYVSNRSGDEVQVQLKWPEQPLAVFSYDVFYQEYFSVAYGAEECEQLEPNRNTDFTRTRGVGDYADHAGALYQNTDAYFAGLEHADTLESGQALSFETKLAVDGPGVGNGYMNYEFSYNNTITLDRIDTTYQVVHRYYTSTDGGEYVLDGEIIGEPISGLVGQIILASDQPQQPEYNGAAYTYYGASGDLELTADPAQNRIVLEYRRTVETPTDPGETDPDETLPTTPETDPPTGTEQPDGPGGQNTVNQPETGDGLFHAAVPAAALSAAAAIILIRKRKNG